MKRNAFTLIEIMVAIVILTILGGLLLFALRGAGNSAKVNATKITLENLKSMLAEYELKTKLNAGPSAWQLGGVNHPAGTDDFWNHIGANPAYDFSLNYPKSVSLVSDRSNNDSDLVHNTAIALAWLQKIPSNAAVFGKLPSSAMMTVPAGTVLKDAWDNPIIFVPSDGLSVMISGNWVTIKSPNNRPFFASAGPNGNFSSTDPSVPAADDNLYSFEQ